METEVVKVSNEDNSKTFTIAPVWWDNSFEFTLFHGANAWSANVRRGRVSENPGHVRILQGI